MRRVLPIVLATAALALGAAGPAAAKEPLHAGMLVVCGPGGCAPFDDEAALTWLDGLMHTESPTRGAIPSLAPYYELRYSPSYAQGNPPPLGWVVPGEEAIRAYNFVSPTWRSEWYALDPGVSAAIASAAGGLEPFSPPGLDRVEVRSRPVGVTEPYLDLLGPLPEAFTPSAGSERLTVDLRATSLSPWTLGRDAALEYALAEQAVRIAGRWYEVSGSLAGRIELDAGPAPPPAASSPWGSIAAALAAGALAFAAAFWAVRRRRSPGAATPRAG
jgi:hypothetical protein